MSKIAGWSKTHDEPIHIVYETDEKLNAENGTFAKNSIEIVRTDNEYRITVMEASPAPNSGYYINSPISVIYTPTRKDAISTAVSHMRNLSINHTTQKPPRIYCKYCNEPINHSISSSVPCCTKVSCQDSLIAEKSSGSRYADSQAKVLAEGYLRAYLSNPSNDTHLNNYLKMMYEIEQTDSRLYSEILNDKTISQLLTRVNS